MLFINLNTIGMAGALGMLDGVISGIGSGRVTYVVGTDVEYAPYVEFGTSRQRAQPYLRPAAREVQANVATHISGAASLEAAVQSAAQDVERRAKQKCPVDTGNLRASIRTTKQQ